MVLCFASGCSHRTVKDTCSFFVFPKDRKKHALWTKMARRADRDPGSDDRLCSCHFENGDKKKDPTIFGYNEGKRLDVLSVESRKRSLQELENTSHKLVKHDINAIILQNENEILKEKNQQLEEALQTQQCKFQFSQIQKNDRHVLMYTGLPNAKLFFGLVAYISKLSFTYVYGWNVENLTLEDQLFITLQKLRQNYTFSDLAVRYSVSDTTIRNVFYTMISVIHESLYKCIMCNKDHIASLNKIQKHMPSEHFTNCRFLIDTTEIFIENPRSDLEAQRQTYSQYKKRQTFKGLIAVAPNGIICFTSKLFPGSTSDKVVFKESGLIDLLHPGDLILADKGFLIHDLLPQGVSLNIPPFLINPQFTEQEAKFTTQLARKRVHVERAIRRMKKFEILDLIPDHLRPEAPKIFQVIAVLVNLQNPILKC